MIYTKATFAILLEKQAIERLASIPLLCSRAHCKNLAVFRCDKCSGWDSYCSQRCQEQDRFVHRQFCSDHFPRESILPPRDVVQRLGSSFKNFGNIGTVEIFGSIHGPELCQEVKCPCKTFRASSHCLQFTEQQFPILVDQLVAKEVTDFLTDMVCEELPPILCDRRFMVDYCRRVVSLLQKTENPDWDSIAKILDKAAAFSRDVLGQDANVSHAFAVEAYNILMLKYGPDHKQVQKAVNRVVDGCINSQQYDDALLYASNNLDILMSAKNRGNVYDADDLNVATMQMAHITRTLVVLGSITGEESMAELQDAETYARQVVDHRRKVKADRCPSDLPTSLQLLADILEMKCSKVGEEEEILRLHIEAVAIISALRPLGLETGPILAKKAKYCYRRAERLRGEGDHEQSQRFFSVAIASMKKAEEISHRNQSDKNAFAYRLMWLQYGKRMAADDYQSPGFHNPVEEVSAQLDEKEIELLGMDYPEFIK